MTRQELIGFIHNSIAIGEVVNGHKFAANYHTRDWMEQNYIEILGELMDGSVEVSGMYFKELDNKEIELIYLGADFKILDLGDAVDQIGEFAFFNNRSLKELYAPFVTKIHQHSFMNCSIEVLSLPSLKYVHKDTRFPLSVKDIDFQSLEELPPHCFEYCRNLESVNVSSVKRIGGSSFFCCSNLSKVKATSLEMLDKDAFGSCPSLTALDAPKLKYINRWAFANIGQPSVIKQIGYSKLKLFLGQIQYSLKDIFDLSHK